MSSQIRVYASMYAISETLREIDLQTDVLIIFTSGTPT